MNRKWHRVASNPHVYVWWLAAVLLLALSGCGDRVGTACETVGSGFHASHNCRHKCLSRWQIICPDGAAFAPMQCSGTFGCEPGSCPEGQACYHDDDPFDDRSFCVAATVCGDLSADQLNAWEQQSRQRQAQVRAAREEKAARRAAWQAEHGGGVTTDVDTKLPHKPESTAPD